MITKPTVFVLGAGVSMPYGFPSGKQLVEQICEATQVKTSLTSPIPDDSRYLISRENIQNILFDNFGKPETQKFGNALFLSHQVSIDAFLEHRQEFTEIGKLAIALFILRKEMEAELFSFENRYKGCYQHLFSKLNTGWEKFKQNKVSFITFNYDRSLENFLFTSLQNTYSKSENEIAEQLSEIHIIHVHGSLGKLKWQEAKGIPYGTLDEYTPLNRLKFNTKLALDASRQIKIITENRSNFEEFQSAFKLLSEAERIYFLGFGYHPTNIERLGIQNLARKNQALHYANTKLVHAPMMGTAFGMEEAEILSVQNRWEIGMPDNTSDSLLFLRKYADLN